MKILGRENQYSAYTFGRALTLSEEKDFNKVTDEAMQSLGIDEGMHIFKIFQTALPNEQGQDLGVGKLNSSSAIDYLKFNAFYTGANIVKIYPAGQIPSKLRFENYYCPYERSATVIGEDNINFFKLTTEKYGCLLTDADISSYVVSENSSYVDYENELDEKRGVIFSLISKAYENMQKLDTSEKVAIKNEFDEFKDSNTSDTMDRLAIAPFVREIDSELF